MTKGTTYADAGVNIELGDEASEVLYNAARLTWENREGEIGEVIEPTEDFSGLRATRMGSLPNDTFLGTGFDGIGTKTLIAQRVGKHHTIAHDLFAMVCDDAVVRGGEPIHVGSVLDVNSLEGSHIEAVKQLGVGYVTAAREANVAVINGEIAELGACIGGYGDFNYNWGASVTWLARGRDLITGKHIPPGEHLIGLREGGFRSNGISLVRKTLADNYGENWHEAEWEGQNVGELALTPSIIYTRAVVDMLGGFYNHPKVDISGIAHITGGGLPGKVGRMLKPSGLGARITDPFEPPAFMTHVQELGQTTDREAYKTWNMGQGMVIAARESGTVIGIARAYGLEAEVIGEVVKEPGIEISSRGAYAADEKTLVYN